MDTTPRLHRAMTLAALLSLVMLATASQATAGGPYEIPAKWTDDSRHLAPVGVDFAFDSIQYVPRLGAVIYGDHLLLRIEQDEPFVTLGIHSLHDTPTPVAYTSAAELADGTRLLTRSTWITEEGARVRETVLVQLDEDGRGEKPFSFPQPTRGTAWTSIRLITDADGQIFAYAGRSRPKMVPINFTDVSPALEQHFFRYTTSGWQELPRLDPHVVSASDACFVDGALIVVGSRIENDSEGKAVLRRGVVAELSNDRWSAIELDAPGGAAAFSMTGLRCGRTRDRVYATAAAAAPDQPIGHTFLRGTPGLYHRDGGAWQPIVLPAPPEGDPIPHIAAFNIDRTGALWLSYAGDAAVARTGPLFRYKDAVWTPVLLPPVPETTSYSLSGIVFDDDGYGWAIANRNGNAVTPESHGVLLAYDGNDRNEWKLRGWKWNSSRQRWFGLFGNLR